MDINLLSDLIHIYHCTLEKVGLFAELHIDLLEHYELLSIDDTIVQLEQLIYLIIRVFKDIILFNVILSHFRLVDPHESLFFALDEVLNIDKTWLHLWKSNQNSVFNLSEVTFLNFSVYFVVVFFRHHHLLLLISQLLKLLLLTHKILQMLHVGLMLYDTELLTHSLTMSHAKHFYRNAVDAYYFFFHFQIQIIFNNILYKFL